MQTLKRKINSQVRSASGGTRSGAEAVKSRMTRAKKLRPAARAHENTKITQEGEATFSQQFSNPAAKRTQLRNRREGDAAAKTIAARRKTRGTVSRGGVTGSKSVGSTTAKNRRIAVARRIRQIPRN